MSMTRLWGAVGTTSASFGAHAAGDFLIAFVFRDGSTTAPTVPSGWIEVATGAANTCWGGLYFKIANSSGETSGAWTNASRISVACYRPGGTRGLGIGAVATGGAASTTVSYPALTMAIGDGSSWVGGAAGHRSTNTSLEDAPTGMTNVAAASGVDGTAETAFHDTDGPVSSWSNQNVSVGGTSSGWRSFTFEIVHRTVFNPRDKGPDAVLSSANTIIVSTGGAGNQYARATVGRRAGDHVIRFTIGGNSYTFAGVATHDASLTSSPSNGGKIGYRTSTPEGGSPEGRFYTADGEYIGGLPLAQPGDVVDIYISRSLGRMWVVINGTPTTGNPSAKTGGYDITTSLTAGAPLFPISGGDNNWGWGYDAAEVTIDAALTGVTLPSGWEPWDGIEAAGTGAEVEVPAAVAEAAAYAPSVATGASVAVPAAAAAAAAQAPTVATGARVEIPSAQAQAQASAPAVGTGAIVAVPAALAEAEASAPSVATGASVQVPVSSAVAEAFPPVVPGGATVEVPAAVATAQAFPPAVGGGAAVFIPAQAAQAQANAPAVGGGASVQVPGQAAEAEAFAPGVATGAAVQVPAAVAAAEAFAPDVGDGAAVQVPAAVATAQAFPPTIATGASVQVPAAVAEAIAFAPSVGQGVLIEVPAALATATAGEVEIFTGAAVAVPAAEASADAAAPTIATGAHVAIPAALAQAEAFAPTVGSAAVVEVPAAVAEAQAFAPQVATGTGVEVPAALAEAVANDPAAFTGAAVVIPAALAEAEAFAPAAEIGTNPLARVQLAATYAPTGRLAGRLASNVALSGRLERKVS